MFFGREDLLEDLGRLWHKRTSSFVTCRGRRRIGKSSLIEQFAARSSCRFIEISGAAVRPKMTNADQLSHFCEQLADQSTLPKGVSVNTWMAAFRLLSSVIHDSERTVVLLDEVSWMGRFDPNFAGELKTVWDKELKRHDKLVFVVCGSVSTWIQRNILESSAFAGRLSLNIVVDELPLKECLKFWGEKVNRLSEDEVIDVLSVTGGVPKYLEEIDPSASADENIRRLCFSANGALVDEFNQIFSEVFEETAQVKKSILRVLKDAPLPAVEIAKKLGVDRNGHLTRNLDELATAGFIAKDDGLNPDTGKPMKISTYRIRDNYTRFYLHHMEPRMSAIKAGSFVFTSLENLAGWKSILGLQFENLVVSHYREFLQKLHLGSSLITSAAPFRKHGQNGVQIDLLLQLANCFYVVEVKHQTHIGVEIEKEMSERIAKLPGRGRRSVRMVLVYCGELDPAVEERRYFDVIVSASELLGIK